MPTITPENTQIDLDTVIDLYADATARLKLDDLPDAIRTIIEAINADGFVYHCMSMHTAPPNQPHTLELVFTRDLYLVILRFAYCDVQDKRYFLLAEWQIVKQDDPAAIYEVAYIGKTITMPLKDRWNELKAITQHQQAVMAKVDFVVKTSCV